MDENQGQSYGERGVELLSWEFTDDLRQGRGPMWYMVMLMLGGGMLVYAMAVGNFLFALIIVMFGLIIYLSSLHSEEVVQVVLTDRGLIASGEFFPYNDMQHFWFAYDPPNVKAMYVEFRTPWKPRLGLELESQNPNAVREILADYVVEDLTQDEEPLSEVIAKILKL